MKTLLNLVLFVFFLFFLVGCNKEPQKSETKKNFQVKFEGKIAKTYFYRDIIPLDISEIELDQNSSDTIEEYSVTFHYSNWDIE